LNHTRIHRQIPARFRRRGHALSFAAVPAVEMVEHLRYDTMHIASAEVALGALAASRGAK
jgi:hypothetical protein